MTIEDKIRDEKQQYNINREASKVPLLSSSIIIFIIIKKYESEEILPFDQSRMIE